MANQTFSTQTALGELARHYPGAIPLFEKWGLDYCCGGGLDLETACRNRGLDPAGVLAGIQQHPTGPEAGSPAAEDWRDLSPQALVDHIERTHHAYLKETLPQLSRTLDKVVNAHRARHPELESLASAFRQLREDLEPHLMKEEQVLFPMIRKLPQGPAAAMGCPLQSPIGVMRMEHEQAGTLLANLRRITQGYQVPADGCASYQSLMEGLERLEADLHLHIFKENEILFPEVLADAQTAAG
ncbi:MAG: iron-sulfur cluster repair di-iron protein [Nitrospinaceae bacterium]